MRLGLQWARTGAAETQARQLPRASGWRCQERGRKWFVGSGDEAEAVRCGFCPGNLTHADGAEAPLPQGAVSAITGPGWAGQGGCALRERPNGASGTQGRPRGPRFPHRRVGGGPVGGRVHGGQRACAEGETRGARSACTEASREGGWSPPRRPSSLLTHHVNLDKALFFLRDSLSLSLKGGFHCFHQL